MGFLTTLLPAALNLGIAWFQSKVTKTITEAQYKEKASAYAIARAKGNKSADARISIDNQFQQLEKEKLDEQAPKNL